MCASKADNGQASLGAGQSLRHPTCEDLLYIQLQGRACGASLRDPPGPRVLPRIHRRLSEGWQGLSPGYRCTGPSGSATLVGLPLAREQTGLTDHEPDHNYPRQSAPITDLAMLSTAT